MPITAGTHTDGNAVIKKAGSAWLNSCNGPWTHECCFEVDVFICWECTGFLVQFRSVLSHLFLRLPGFTGPRCLEGFLFFGFKSRVFTEN